MTVSDLTIGVVGAGGDGAISVGEILTSAAAAEGLYCFLMKSYGAQIKGGESSARVRMSQEPVLTQGDALDILVAFNWSDFQKFDTELALRKGCVVLYDPKDPTPVDEIPIPPELEAVLYPIPFDKIAKDTVKTSLAKNVVSLGVLLGMFKLPADGIDHAIRKLWTRKGEKVLNSNLEALQAGVKYGESIDRKDDLSFEYTSEEPKLAMTGNEALAYGALYAGCRFYAGYPITPSTDIMEWLAKELPRFGGVMVQAEDELAAIGMCIGAAWSGAKAMTSTSGPGFSLMQEQVGLAAMAEIPLVIVNVQRGGPSTGLPTRLEQSDLQQALYGTHGDACRVVIAPADVEDCFDVAMEAFYIAEKYQIPVIILSDAFIAHRKECIPRIDLTKFKFFERSKPNHAELEDYRRYRLTDRGVSPMSEPGMVGGQYLMSGIEHDEYGAPKDITSMHETMNHKRFKKLEFIREEINFCRTYGSKEAKIGVIAWGSSKGPVKEAILRLEQEGHKVRGFIPQVLYPLAFEKFENFLRPLSKLVIVELSYTAQFLKYLKSHFDIGCEQIPYKRSGGTPLTVEEIYEVLLEAIEHDRPTSQQHREIEEVTAY